MFAVRASAGRNVSRETGVARVTLQRADVLKRVKPDVGRRLDVYVELLQKWQRTINLVAPSTLREIWHRHIADSLQVQVAAPEARLWVDCGSGGGFPGLVTAIVLSEIPDAEVHLIESDKRKAAFLRTVSRETGLRTEVHAARIEEVVSAWRGPPPDAVSARALAPLSKLVDYAEPFLQSGAVGVFLKGESVDAELTQLDGAHKFTIESIPSSIDQAGRLILVRAVGARPRCGGA